MASRYQRAFMRFVPALLAVAAILLATACGGGGSSNNPPVKGGFSKTSLNGQYAFTTKGFGFDVGSSSSADFFTEGGIFTADGNGNITSGIDDFVQELPGGGTGTFSDNVTGTYTINNDGTGDLTFNFQNGGRTDYRITLSDTNHFVMAEEDGLGTSLGSGEKQDSSRLSTVPSGTFIARNHDLLVSVTMARLVIASGAITGTYFEVDPSSTFNGNVTGTVNTPSNGRGTLSYSLDGENHTFVYYVINANKIRLLDQTANVLSVGSAEAQSGTFTNASLSGSYAFGGSGETTVVDGINTVGVFTTDGGGNVTGGAFDAVQDGGVSSDIAISSGTYTVGADGLADLALGSDQKKVWMVSPSRGFFISLNGSVLEDGTFDKQAGSFSNTTLNSQATLAMDGFDGQLKARVGTLVPNGAGITGTNYVSSFFDANTLLGGSQLNSFAGTYSVANNGRATAQFTGFTNNMVFYLTSGSTGYILQADGGVNIGGTITQQVSP